MMKPADTAGSLTEASAAATGHTRFLVEVEIRRVLCSTNAIESLIARHRRAVKARGHVPSEQAALRCLHLVTRSLGRPAKAGHDGRCAGDQP